MKLPASLSKLKSLFPVVVVGSSVLITIKLLTESNPLSSEILKVDAVEDIQKTDYQDELKEPEPEKPPVPEEPPSPPEPEIQSNQDQQEATDEDDKQEGGDSNSDENQQEKQQQESQKQQDHQQPKGGRRAFKSNGGTVVEILKQFFGQKKQ
ncbi:hypothetical protein A6V39_05795 [Candidatus Mycoplasma haematobovis]|uniref:Uncharacterized protein n=1 Tax=Candidatus Mycoplasma haematobovis TaxID=432608 RepID=A0A1A9QE83_9MOLU|nr:hypothetical protein [Candidatus Mycoplasma haematobovis]OAL10787.1 hypothetical protein A6V39_05795 [Candidatus Mycoplasma haematobovis]